MNLPDPAPRPSPCRPSLVFFGDSLSVDAHDVLVPTIINPGYGPQVFSHTIVNVLRPLV